MLNPPLRFPLAWHLVQLRLRIGLMSAAKSIFLLAAAGISRGAGLAAVARGAASKAVAIASRQIFVVRRMSTFIGWTTGSYDRIFQLSGWIVRWSKPLRGDHTIAGLPWRDRARTLDLPVDLRTLFEPVTRPLHTAYHDRIGKYEATGAEYCEFLNAVVQLAPTLRRAHGGIVRSG